MLMRFRMEMLQLSRIWLTESPVTRVLSTRIFPDDDSKVTLLQSNSSHRTYTHNIPSRKGNRTHDRSQDSHWKPKQKEVLLE
jgi:hypothetical protein